MEIYLSDGWRMAVCSAGRYTKPSEVENVAQWYDARVPTTAAAVLSAHGQDSDLFANLFDYDVWWCSAPLPEGMFVLQCEGLASWVDIWLDNIHLGTSQSMYTPFAHEISIAGGMRLWFCCRAIDARIDTVRPRARWRTRLVAKPGLRAVRTTLMGQIPSFMPRIDAVGPYKPVVLHPMFNKRLVESSVRPTLMADGSGQLEADIKAEGVRSLILSCAGRSVELELVDGRYRGGLAGLAVEPWWPHTHGTPNLYPVRLEVDGKIHELGNCGFRRVELVTGPDGGDFAIHVNGKPVFCRGATYFPADPLDFTGFSSKDSDLLVRAQTLGANMIRVSGLGLYPDADFYRACDTLGLLVWQDLMFATFDYPSDEGFISLVEREVSEFLCSVQLSPSLGILCGGTETFQQPALMGLSAASHPLFERDMPRWVSSIRPNTPFVPNTPYGGVLPIATDKGVCHYYGVGAYRRAIDAVRRANVRFAAECLGFSNPPDDYSLRHNTPGLLPGSAEWKMAVPRDGGVDWDFEDVSDHYVAMLHGVDPNTYRREDPTGYLDLCRETVGGIMVACFDEWRRLGSSCNGALVWTLNDLLFGAGWGLFDAQGREKSAAFAVRRAWRTLHLGLTDEAENGLGVHIVNETDSDQELAIELVCFRDGHIPVLRRRMDVRLQAGMAQSWQSAEIIGSFFDINYSYRFGPPAHDCVVARLLRGNDVVCERFYYPDAAVYPLARLSILMSRDGGEWLLDIRTDAVCRGVFVIADGFDVDDDGFDVAPDRGHRIRLRPRSNGDAVPQGHLRSRGRILAYFGTGILEPIDA